MGIPCLTSLDTTHAMLKVLKEIEHGERIEYKALQDYQK
jgi:carbamoyl-phosphate synthase large subunit